MKMKKLIAIAMVAAMSLSVAACGSSSSAAPTSSTGSSTTTEPAKNAVKLEIAFNQKENHPQYIALEAFGKALEERTNGAYTVEVFPSELLGAQKETLEMVQSGTIAMTMVGNSILENWNSDFSIFNLPYTFYSIDHQKAVVNNPEIVGELYNSLEGQGIKVLAAFHGGVRNVYTSKGSIMTPEDLKGLQIRVMQSDTNIAMMNMLGGVGVAMGQGEVYTAIQTGVLDGAENNELIFNDLLQYEVAPYYSYTKHLMMPDMLTISTTVWNEMPDDVKAIFNEELMKAVDLEYDSFADAVTVALEAAVEKGAIIAEPDIMPFMEAVAPLTDTKITTDVTKKIYEQIKEVEKQFVS